METMKVKINVVQFFHFKRTFTLDSNISYFVWKFFGCGFELGFFEISNCFGFKFSTFFQIQDFFEPSSKPRCTLPNARKSA